MLRIEPLGSTHDRVAFDCGVEQLNRYLQQVARQHISKGISKTFVAVDEAVPARKPVLGFFTISLCQVLGEDVPVNWAKKLPAQIPAMRLGRLAVARSHQRKGLGRVLLVEAIYRVASVADIAGGVGLFVDAKDDAASAFYAKFGFEQAPASSLTLFLPMETLRRFVAAR